MVLTRFSHRIAIFFLLLCPNCCRFIFFFWVMFPLLNQSIGSFHWPHSRQISMQVSRLEWSRWADFVFGPRHSCHFQLFFFFFVFFFSTAFQVLDVDESVIYFTSNQVEWIGLRCQYFPRCCCFHLSLEPFLRHHRPLFVVFEANLSHSCRWMFHCKPSWVQHCQYFHWFSSRFRPGW